MKLTPEVKAKLFRTVAAFLKVHEADLANPKVSPQMAALRAAPLWEAIPNVLRARLDVAPVHAIYETLRRGCPEPVGRIYAQAQADPAYRGKAQLFWEYLRPREESMNDGDDEIREGPETNDVAPTRAGGPRYAVTAKHGGVPEKSFIPSDPMTRERVTLRDKSGSEPEESVLPVENSPAGTVGEFLMPEDPDDNVRNAEPDELAGFATDDEPEEQDDFGRE